MLEDNGEQKRWVGSRSVERSERTESEASEQRRCRVPIGCCLSVQVGPGFAKRVALCFELFLAGYPQLVRQPLREAWPTPSKPANNRDPVWRADADIPNQRQKRLIRPELHRCNGE